MVVAVTPLEASASAAADSWSLPRRIAFRFGFVYFFLACFPFPIGSIPWTDWLSDRWLELWRAIVVRVGEGLLGLDHVAVETTGSGDTTADYVWLLCHLSLAAVATGVWSLLDRRRPHYRTLYALLRIYVRYTLAFVMLGYGMYKVLPSQFIEPPSSWLLERYGESSPMRLLWTFMGASTPYTIFAGACEVLGALLLLWRRTTLLGAVVLIGVIGNVVALNFCYDVPVKLFSSQLLVMACFLAAPDLWRLVDFFVRNRATAPADLGPRPADRRFRIALLVGKLALVALAGYQTFDGAWEGFRTYGAGAPDDPRAGIWEVESSDPSWHRVAISRWGWVVYDRDDVRRVYAAERDGDGVTLTDGESGATLALTVVEPEAGQLIVSGAIEARLVRVRGERTHLLDRGFHWVNEYPHNR